jgi:hypothetical protein
MGHQILVLDHRHQVHQLLVQTCLVNLSWIQNPA